MKVNLNFSYLTESSEIMLDHLKKTLESVADVQRLLDCFESQEKNFVQEKNFDLKELSYRMKENVIKAEAVLKLARKSELNFDNHRQIAVISNLIENLSVISQETIAHSRYFLAELHSYSDTIYTILKQGYSSRPFEFVVLDDLSLDRLPSIFQELGKGKIMFPDFKNWEERIQYFRKYPMIYRWFGGIIYLCISYFHEVINKYGKTGSFNEKSNQAQVNLQIPKQSRQKKIPSHSKKKAEFRSKNSKQRSHSKSKPIKQSKKRKSVLSVRSQKKEKR